jgi:hypothetical protein
MLNNQPFKNVNKQFEDCTLKIKWDPQFNKNVYEAFKDGGKLQERLDELVYVGLEPYVPRDVGTLYNTAQPIYGSGKIIFATPYAFVQYEGFRETQDGVIIFFENYSNQTGHRGAEWFDRWKEDNGEETVKEINRIAGEMLNGK